MDANQEKLYLELRKTRKEIVERLEEGQGSDLIKPMLKEELRDIEIALEKIQNGEFGRCEFSGELIPENLLMMVPTIKTMKDCKNIDRFFCKPIYS
ncbi:hypothetical protein ACFYKX_00050 [Cytobacillus sp. FJAT-54145]|uniref:DksA C4-type domain-containing protein n=1 Tax=Cytobacillus spartinae TaxID=3299023 RepID=A0ABW6K4C7_9BACI